MNPLKFFDRPIAFHRCFVTLTGSVTAAVMLSQAVYWSSRTDDPEGWFYKTAKEWEEETGLTLREQQGARTKLGESGFWEEALKGSPPILHYRVDGESLQKQMSKLADGNSDKSAKSILTKTQNQFRQKRKIDFDKNAKSISTKAQNQIQQKGKIDFDKSAKSISTKREKHPNHAEITTETTTEISIAAPCGADKNHPAIVFLRSLTNRYPDKSLWPQIADLLGEKFDEQKLRACYTTWVSRGWNKVNFTWLFEWYADGIPDLRNSGPRQGKSQKQINAANTPHDEFIDHCVREFEAEQSKQQRQASEEIIEGELIP